MKDIMLDLETLGTVPGCAIVSFGAVAFDEFGVAMEGFYQAVHVPGWETPGLTLDNLVKDEDTIAWWQGQSEQARAVFTDPNALTTREALERLRSYIAQYGSPRVWGNGADFDNPIVACAAHAVGIPPRSVWRGYDGRCYRTVKNQFKDVKLVRGGTHHNALDDARSQAEHLVQICKTRGWRLV